MEIGKYKKETTSKERVHSSPLKFREASIRRCFSDSPLRTAEFGRERKRRRFNPEFPIDRRKSRDSSPLAGISVVGADLSKSSIVFDPIWIPNSRIRGFLEREREEMGTPAIPNLGKHCSVDDCRQIDFLPFTCDCCQQVCFRFPFSIYLRDLDFFSYWIGLVEAANEIEF